MLKPTALILRAPGTNCDAETAHAFRLAGAEPQRIHLNQLADRPQLATNAQIFCLPGGFSFGDDIAAGRILADQFRHRLPDLMQRLRDDGKLILGICNGFQVLIQTGVLIDAGRAAAAATLTLNDSGKFEDRWVPLRVANPDCVFLRGIAELYLPVAHAEGKFVAGSDELLDRWDTAGQLALRYAAAATASANGLVPFPLNPNGSQRNVAGVCDPTGRVLGLMPHPERYVQRTQHPRWTREQLPAEGAGLQLFRNAVQYCQ